MVFNMREWEQTGINCDDNRLNVEIRFSSSGRLSNNPGLDLMSQVDVRFRPGLVLVQTCFRLGLFLCSPGLDLV